MGHPGVFENELETQVLLLRFAPLRMALHFAKIEESNTRVVAS